MNIPLRFSTIVPCTGDRHTVSMDCAPTMPMAPASPEPSTLDVDSAIPPSSPPPDSRVRRPVVFPSSRVRVASLTDRDTLTEGIAALYDQLDLHAAVVGEYHSLKELCRDQKRHIDPLQTELHSYVELAPRLAAYVQQRYLGLRTNRQDMVERLHGFQTDLARRLGQDHVLQIFKAALSEAERKVKQVDDRRILNRLSPNRK